MRPRSSITLTTSRPSDELDQPSGLNRAAIRRALISSFLSRSFGDAMQRLDGMDASFVYLDTPATPMQVGTTCVFDPSTAPDGYSFRKVRRRVEDRLHLIPSFRRRLVEVPAHLHRPGWVDDPDFDLDEHLHRVLLRAPGGDHRVGAVRSARDQPAARSGTSAVGDAYRRRPRGRDGGCGDEDASRRGGRHLRSRAHGDAVGSRARAGAGRAARHPMAAGRATVTPFAGGRSSAGAAPSTGRGGLGAGANGAGRIAPRFATIGNPRRRHRPDRSPRPAAPTTLP